MPELPKPYRRPKVTGPTLELKEYEVASWCPTPDGTGPPTQVWFLLKLEGTTFDLALRLKTRDAMDTLIGCLERHRDDVWKPAV